MPPPVAPKPTPSGKRATQRPEEKIGQKEIDKVFDDVGKQFGVKGKDLKAMTEQFAASQPKSGKIVGNKFIDEIQGFEVSHPPGWSFSKEMPVPMLSVAVMDSQKTAALSGLIAAIAGVMSLLLLQHLTGNDLFSKIVSVAIILFAWSFSVWKLVLSQEIRAKVMSNLSL